MEEELFIAPIQRYIEEILPGHGGDEEVAPIALEEGDELAILIEPGLFA